MTVAMGDRLERRDRRWRRALSDICWGPHYGFPPCCILRFSLSPYWCQGARRGGKWTDRTGVFGILHHHDMDRPPSYPSDS